ncbi:autotransporter-associated beta strand repeat-containing protein, partial [Zavarzinia sp.]|uniref:acid phosphatase n=1 Tax=Zavarzinia sp. TaxID=2027920 RepID=UPI003562FDB3
MRRSSRGLLATAMVALLCGQIPAARAADAIKLLEQFNTLRDNYPEVIARNLQIVIDVTNSRTAEQEKRAVEDDNNQTIIELSDAFGPVLGPIFAAAFDSTGLFSIDLPSTASALLGSYITVLSAPIAKEYFQNPRPFQASDQVKRADGSSGGGYSYPSGHTTFAYTQLLALGYMFPERYQEILTRASEYGNNRIVVGVHYPLDVIGGRIISEANVAELLANPLTRIGFDLGHTELENYFADKCGATAAECAHADPDQDIFSNHDKNKADYTYRLTYGFTGLFDTSVAMVVPDGAEYLIATRFPYLSTAQLREVLRTTSLASGDALLDYQNWERLNLFAAADGYGAFDSDVTVTMNAADGGFSQYDSWQNDITGPGTLTKAGSGWLDLTGDNSFGGLLVTGGTLRLTGDSTLGSTRVTGGDLLVDGRLAETAPVTAASGGTLGGSGTIDAPVTIENGGTLSPGDGGAGTLTVGSLYLSPASFIEFDLGKPGVIGGGVNDLVVVNGDLTLDGVIDFNAANDRLAPGIYRLFDYAGALDDQGLTLGSIPSNVTASGLTVDSSNPSYVLLHVAGFGDQAVYYWNGTVPTPHDTVYGGSGTWDSTFTNWTNEAGSITSAWAGAHAAFGVTGGTVTIEGRQAFTGLSFYADGYSLVAGTDGGLETSTLASVQVNSGLTALISAPISGSGGIDKTDGGLLVLDGINSYAGGTRISGGTLQVSHDTALGDAAGGLTLDGGILRIAGTDYTATDRSITLGSNGGGFDIADADGVFTVDDALSGTGGLLKSGEGYLVLTGANSYSGGTTVSGGTLIGDSLSLIGDIVDNAAVAFDQAVDGVFAGRIGGVGSLIKTGTGLLVVTGSIAQTGGTTIEQGTLQIGDGGTTGSIANDITVHSTLAFARSDDYSFSDVISGIGSVVQRGS